MGSISVDQTRFVESHQTEPDRERIGLWVFTIQERDICFWGRYSEVLSTAEMYAHAHGIEGGTITLVDCTGTVTEEMRY
jgi:hypothetical protein